MPLCYTINSPPFPAAARAGNGADGPIGSVEMIGDGSNAGTIRNES
jgi:hypothetical protein